MNLEATGTALSSPLICDLGDGGQRGYRRLVRAVTLIGPITAIGRGAARLLLGYKKKATVHASPQQLELHEELFVLGRSVRTRTRLLDVNSLTEITLTTPEADLVWLARLGPLALGTFFGTALLGRAAFGTGFALELIGAAGGVLALGLVVDYWMAWSVPRPKDRATVLLVPLHSDPLELKGPRSVLEPWLSTWATHFEPPASSLVAAPAPTQPGS